MEEAAAQPKKRPWFQLHLSTCVVLMAAVGYILMMNLRVEGGDMTGISGAGSVSWFSTYYLGWPDPFLVLQRDRGYTRDRTWLNAAGEWETQEEPAPSEEDTDPPSPSVLLGLSDAKAGDTTSFHALSMLINTALWLGGLSALAFIIEKCILRRSPPRAAQERAL